MRASRRLPKGYSKIGDDVAVVPSGGRKVVLKVDMLVEGTDVPKGMTYRMAARKAVAMCVSDFAAKGVEPDSFMVSLGLRRGTTNSEVRELALGLREAEDEWGVMLAGGDTNESRELVIDCVMAGFAEKVTPRDGASSGDLLVVTGTFGFPTAGLRILEGGAKASPGFRKKAVESVLWPNPSLRAGISLAPHLSSSMDSSDGLARSLHALAAASGVGFELDALPAAPGVEAFAATNGLDYRRLVWGGGEEYVIVGTLPPENLKSAKRAVDREKEDLFVIGKATKEKGVVSLRQSGSKSIIPDEGWTHLG